MLPYRIVAGQGQIWYVDVLSESGVKWILVRNVCTGNIAGAAALLERAIAMAKKPSRNGSPRSIAEELLHRRKESVGNTNEAYDEDVLNLTPNVHELLTRTLIDDKKVYEPATILMFARAGSWTVCLSHKGLKLKWWGEGGTVRAAVMALERACGKEMGQETVEDVRSNTAQP